MARRCCCIIPALAPRATCAAGGKQKKGRCLRMVHLDPGSRSLLPAASRFHQCPQQHIPLSPRLLHLYQYHSAKLTPLLTFGYGAGEWQARTAPREKWRARVDILFRSKNSNFQGGKTAYDVRGKLLPNKSCNLLEYYLEKVWLLPHLPQYYQFYEFFS